MKLALVCNCYFYSVLCCRIPFSHSVPDLSCIRVLSTQGTVSMSSESGTEQVVQNVGVTSSNADPTTANISPDPPVVASVATARRFRLDLRSYYSFWYKPTIPEIHQALDTIFPEENPIMEQGYGNYLMSFTIHLNKQVPVLPVLYAQLKRPTCYTASLDEFINVPLQPLPDNVSRDGSPNNRADGILLTIVRAVFISRETPNEAFDAAFSEFGEVTKPCELQKDTKHHKYNGNRYLIVKFKEGQHIPDTIAVTNPITKRKIQYKVRYANMSWNCGRCDERHQGKCPKAQKLKVCDDVRNKDKLSALIVGDSTIRHIEQRALKAEVASMPGGTLGQLTAAALDHPNLDTNETTYIVGGTNNVKVAREEENFDEITRIRLFTHASQSLFKMITDNTDGENAPKLQYVITTPNEQDLTPEESVRREYLVSGLKEIANDRDKVELIEIGTEVEKTVDGHPTYNGTGQLINSFLGDTDLVIDADVSRYAKPYRGLQRMWKAGCQSCRKIGVFEQLDRCEPCLKTLTSMIDSKAIPLETWVNNFKAIKELRNPPATPSSSPDYNMIPPTTPPTVERNISPPATPAKKMRNTSDTTEDEPQALNTPTQHDGSITEMES